MAIGDVGDHGGPILERAQLFVRLRGTGWITGAFKSNDAHVAFKAVLASPYLSSLVRYRGVRRARLVQFESDPSNMGHLGPDPRKFVSGNIWIVPDAEIQSVVVDMASERRPEDDSTSLFMVVISQDPVQVVPESPNANGYHQSFDSNGRTLHYAVVLHQSASTLDHSWHYIPGVFSHELVEACTDPEPPGGFLFQDGDEICDLNDERHVNLTGLDHEIDLAAYQSQLENKAVVPTAYSLRIVMGLRPADSVSSVKPFVKNGSVSAAIFVRCNP